MPTYVLQILAFIFHLQSDPVSMESQQRSFELGDQWQARVLHNTITEQRPAKMEPPDEQGFVRRTGGTLRTDLLTLVLTDPERPNRRDITWNYSESRQLFPDGSDFHGHRRPTVEDVALADDDVLILHIADSRNRLTWLSRSNGPDVGWHVQQSVPVDVSPLARDGQDSISVVGRIVRFGDQLYLHFAHPGFPEKQVVLIVNDQREVSPVSDADNIQAVVDTRD